MITIIKNSQEIDTLYKQLQEKLDVSFIEKIDCWVGFPSGSFQSIVRYSPDIDLWISTQELGNRYWNGFGIGRPYKGVNNSLNGEINFPYEGIDRRIAGTFAIDDDNNVLILHRGKIGGGRPGVGKTLFINNFRGDFITAIDGDRETTFCLVGELNSPYFLEQIKSFIVEIKRIKYLDNINTLNEFKELEDYNFIDEHSGETTIEINRNSTVIRTHGIVVNALAKELENRDYKIGNDRNRDLFIYNRKKIITLFEIKTSCITQDLYSAIGQLIIYSIPIKTNVNLILVLPDKLNTTVEKRLAQFGIELLYYKWKNNKPIFIEFDQFFHEKKIPSSDI